LSDGIYFVDKVRKITYWNRAAEVLTGHKAAKVMGKYCWDDILTHHKVQTENLCEKYCPLEKTITDGKSRKAEAYVRHKDGHLLPVVMRMAPLRDTKDQIIGGAVILTDNSATTAMSERSEAYEKLALHDPLTKLANRRYMDMILNNKFMEMVRYGWPFGILFVDIDRFKEVNDRYGHDIGDKILLMVARTIVSNVRTFDVVGRWGGEEFMSIIVNVDEDELRILAHRICFLVERSQLTFDSEPINVTVSIGATTVQPFDTVDTMLKRVDKLLYKSKAAGRNRVSTKL
jgi:diguanylate cyclase (GGDEF)-like protein/PAS domain S-box-containing protein